MDGNGRWAKARGLPRVAGHKVGVDSVREIVRAAGEIGIQYLTLYAFSTENWLRPQGEVTALWKIMAQALRSETARLNKNNVRLRALGRLDGLPEAVRAELLRAVDTLKANTGLNLNLALNYGARQEIVDAVAAMVAAGVRDVTEEAISSRLYTAGMPDPDLVIRTSGEMRLSNFLAWQCAYAELYVTPVFWPDFRRKQLEAAVAEYGQRHRRFGGL
ncbi:MAG: di-trans,poly-cis-decaprenylcistransferase [Elusimicrobia bacterium]|nr:di-trans,poly-cis-decaprenylcistransferase [Elusimicrobiota bacterium]